MVVAIDGPGGVGKSTVTRAIAVALGWDYLDTGATYRAAALAALRAGVDLENAAAVVEVVRSADIGFSAGEVSLDGDDVTDQIRSAEVTEASSLVSRYPQVREIVVDLQRAWVARRAGDAVVEGRDIGTVVFPDAPVKIYLTASPEVRARRRIDQVEASGLAARQIAEDLLQRDEADSSRETSPLRPAADAVVVDTTQLTLVEVVNRALDIVHSTQS